jgi:hypothetical protein
MQRWFSTVLGIYLLANLPHECCFLSMVHDAYFKSILQMSDSPIQVASALLMV